MRTEPCMGGWCVKRGHCPHYHAESDGQEIAERLCLPGSDGARLVQASPSRVVVADALTGEALREVACPQ